MSDSLRPHGQQHPRPPCQSPAPRVAHLPKLMCIESVMPFNHLILVIPFSSCPQSFPASGSFQMSRLFASGGQSIGVKIKHYIQQLSDRAWSIIQISNKESTEWRSIKQIRPTDSFVWPICHLIFQYIKINFEINMLHLLLKPSSYLQLAQ